MSVAFSADVSGACPKCIAAYRGGRCPSCGGMKPLTKNEFALLEEISAEPEKLFDSRSKTIKSLRARGLVTTAKAGETFAAHRKSPISLWLAGLTDAGRSALSVRKYHVMVVNERTKLEVRMTVAPVSHDDACTILRKLTPHSNKRFFLREA